MKKISVILIVLLLILGSSPSVFATVDKNEYALVEEVEVSEFSELKTSDTSDINIIQTLTGYNFLYDLGYTISYYANGLFYLGGYTETNNTVDSIITQVYLQRYNTSSKTWSTAYSFSNTQNNSLRVSAYNTYSADTGHYYRVYVSHTARKGTSTETSISYSEAIYAY